MAARDRLPSTIAGALIVGGLSAMPAAQVPTTGHVYVTGSANEAREWALQSAASATSALSSLTATNTARDVVLASQATTSGYMATTQGYMDTALTHRNDAQAAASAAGASNTAAAASELAAAASEAAAATSAANALTSEGNAAGSATASQTSRLASEAARDLALQYRDTANSHRGAAATSETNAATSETNAAGSASAALADRQAAQTARTGAETARTGSEGARDLALQYRDTANSHRGAAATSEANAAGSASAALADRGLAETARTGAQTAQTNAEGARDLALQYRNTANEHRGAAATSAANAATSEGNAAGSASAALTSQGNAATSATLAQRWANEAYNVEVTTGKYSALHWAEVAMQFATGHASNIDVTPVGGISSLNAQDAFAELDAEKSNVGHTHLWAEITDKPATFAPAAHTHLWAHITDKPATFAPSYHTHSIEEVGNLIAALDAKAPLASPALTGTPTAPTAALGTNTTQIATTAYVRGEVAALVDASPGALDTLNELAAALGDDPNFATTMTNALAGKANLAQVNTFTANQTISAATGSAALALTSVEGGASAQIDADSTGAAWLRRLVTAGTSGYLRINGPGIDDIKVQNAAYTLLHTGNAKRIYQIVPIWEVTDYTRASITLTYISDRVTITPSSPTSRVLIISSAYFYMTRTAATHDEMRVNIGLGYYTGTAYAGWANTLWGTVNTGVTTTAQTVYNNVILPIVSLGPSERRTDTGTWFFSVWGAPDYADMSMTMAQWWGVAIEYEP